MGNIVTGPNDLLVVHTDGDLWLHPGALTSNAGVPVRLADFTDPRAPSGPEGSGPNIVEDVAGEVGGVVYYSDCCEPIMGELLASTGENSELIRLGSGYSPALNPERTKLATVNNVQLVVIDLTTGDSQARSLNESSVWIEPWDLIWTRDGAALVVLDFADTEWRLSRFVPDRLFKLDVTAPLGVPFDPESDVFVQLAGRGPDGEIAVVVGDGKTTVLRYFDPDTLDEIGELQRTLPAGVRSVRLAEDGVGLLWAEGTSLRYLPAGGESVDLGDGAAAAWFA